MNLGCTWGTHLVRQSAIMSPVGMIDHTMFHFIPEPVEAKIQVFHVTMMFRILGHSDCTLIVHFEGGGFLNTIPKF